MKIKELKEMVKLIDKSFDEYELIATEMDLHNPQAMDLHVSIPDGNGRNYKIMKLAIGGIQ